MSVYLRLFHGRKNLNEQLENWGSNGPVLGPLEFVHITYLSNIGISQDLDLAIVGDLVYYDGIYYGDFSIFDADALLADGFAPEPVDPAKVTPPQLK